MIERIYLRVASRSISGAHQDIAVYNAGEGSHTTNLDLKSPILS